MVVVGQIGKIWKVDVLVFVIYLVGTWESAERIDILIKYATRATSQ